MKTDFRLLWGHHKSLNFGPNLSGSRGNNRSLKLKFTFSLNSGLLRHASSLMRCVKSKLSSELELNIDDWDNRGYCKLWLVLLFFFCRSDEEVILKTSKDTRQQFYLIVYGQICVIYQTLWGLNLGMYQAFLLTVKWTKTDVYSRPFVTSLCKEWHHWDIPSYKAYVHIHNNLE